MKRVLQALALLYLFALPAFGQGALFNDRVQAVDGRAIGGITVTICTYNGAQYNSQGQYTGPIPCTPAVTTYYDPALSLPTSGLISDSQGNVMVYLPAGTYTVTYSGGNIRSRGFSIVLPCAPGSGSSTCSGSSAPLTSTQVGFGNNANQLSGDSMMTFNSTSKNLSIPSLNSIIYVDGVKYPTVAAAVAALATNSELDIPPGTFTINNSAGPLVVSTPQIRVKGAARGTILQCTTTTNDCIQVTGANQSWDNIEITYSSTPSSGAIALRVTNTGFLRATNLTLPVVGTGIQVEATAAESSDNVYDNYFKDVAVGGTSCSGNGIVLTGNASNKRVVQTTFDRVLVDNCTGLAPSAAMLVKDYVQGTNLQNYTVLQFSDRPLWISPAANNTTFDFFADNTYFDAATLDEDVRAQNVQDLRIKDSWFGAPGGNAYQIYLDTNTKDVDLIADYIGTSNKTYPGAIYEAGSTARITDDRFIQNNSFVPTSSVVTLAATASYVDVKGDTFEGFARTLWTSDSGTLDRIGANTGDQAPAGIPANGLWFDTPINASIWEDTSCLPSATPATSGSIRLCSNGSIKSNNNAGSGDISWLFKDSGDVVHLGGTAGSIIGGPLTAPNVTDTALTPGNCVQASTGGQLTTTASACGSGGGGVTAAFAEPSVGASGTTVTPSPQTIDVSVQTGADFCAKLAAALTQAGDKNAYIDGRGFTATQSCASNPLSGLTNADSNVVIQMPCQRITTTAGWAIPATNDVKIIGCGKQGGSVLAAASGFPASTALITVGVSGSIVDSDMIQDWRLDCSGTASANCQTYVSFGINEHSGLQSVVNIGQNSASATAPLMVIGDTNQTGLPGHYTFHDVDCSHAGANDCVYVHADGAQLGDIQRVTCNNSGLNTGLACIHFFDDFGSGHTLEVLARNVHAEGFTDAVYFDTATFGSVTDIDGTGTISNIVHINTIYSVSATALYSSQPSANIVNDVTTGCQGACVIAGSTTARVTRFDQAMQSAAKNQTFAVYNPGVAVSNLTDSALTSGDCVQPGAGGLLASTAGPCASPASYTLLNIKTAVSPAAVGDARKEGGITWTGSAATTITAPNSVWSASDVGKKIFCNDTTAFTNLVAVGTTISTFNSATSITISASTLGSTSNAQCVWYTQDDTAAFQAANTILTTGAPVGGLINPANWYPSNPTLSSAWSHVLEYMPCGGYVVSATIFNVPTAQVGVGLWGESEGCVTIFISPSYSPGSNQAMIFAQGPIANSKFGNFQIDGVNFSNTAAFNNKFVMSVTCFSCSVENLAGYNVISGGGSNGAVLNVSGAFFNLNNTYIQNNGYGGCEVNAGNAIIWQNSVCSNDGVGGNVENLLVFNVTTPQNMTGGKVVFSGDLIDECGTGPCTQIINSNGVDFDHSTLWSSHNETSTTIDGTSDVSFEHSIIGPYNKQATSTGLNVASGGVARISDDFFYSNGAGNSCIVNAGSVYDLGGNRCTVAASATPLSGAGTLFGSPSITGVAQASGNIALGAGWGSTAAVSAVSGTDSLQQFTITTGGAGIAANPTVTITQPTHAWGAGFWAVPICTIGPNQGNDVIADSVIGTVTQSSVPFTWEATPTTGKTYTFTVRCQNP